MTISDKTRMASEHEAYSQGLKREAEEFLKSTNIQNLLSHYGDVNLIGSFANDLMVDRDLDFNIIVRNITPRLRSEVVSELALQEWVYGISMTDRFNFEPKSNLGAPRGLYVGLTIPFPVERWNIDIWFITPENVPSSKIDELISNATQEQKDTIMRIKYELMKANKKVKGATSVEVYKAVILDGILTTAEFLNRSSNRV